MAKAIQAALNAFSQSPPHIAEDYLYDGEGTQVVLVASADELRSLFLRVEAAGLPCVFYDEAIGIGPALRHQVDPFTQHLQLYR